jgi:ABC-type glycerol-3-phosphate transport system permease component
MAKSASAVQSVSSKALTYLILTVTGIVVLVPFLLALSGSLKTVGDVFTYPPRFLPYAATSVQVDGKDVPLFEVPLKDGTVVELARVKQGVSVREWADPADPSSTFLAPADQFTETTKTIEVAGESVSIFTDSSGAEFANVGSAIVGVYQDPQDSSAPLVYLPSADLKPVETVSAELGNFGEVLKLNGFDRAITNTVLVTVLVVVGQLFTSILGGYAFARLRFKGRDSIFLLWLGSIMIPFVVIIIPLFQLMVGVDWVNNLGSLVIPFIFSAYGTFLMRQFFVTIPKELEEAALIDGASRWTILWKIFVPLSIPAIATLTTFAFLYAWNSFLWPLIVIDSGNEAAAVLAPALSVLGGRGADQPNLILAGVILAISAPILVFIFAQRAFVENAQSSGLKG